MKKFFKNLALVLALVLIVGSLPMAQAKAAEPELKKTAKSLYVGGSIGQTEDGVKSPVLKSAKVAGFVANAGEAKITAKSADKTIAKVKYGRIYAVAPGATKVTVYADGEEIGTIDVTVKKNSTEVAINNAPETITVGETYDLDRDKNGVGDHTSYVVVEGKATVDAKGNLVATAAGDVKVKVYAYQSKTYSKATAESEVVTIKAVPGVEKADQTSKNTIALTCVNKESAAAIAKEDVVAYTKLGDAKINVIVKSVTPAENVATVTFYADLAAKTTYYVEVAGKLFTVEIPELTKKDAAKIEIAADNYAGGADVNLTYKVYTENGIDITYLFSTGEVTLETKDYSVAYMPTSSKLTFIGAVGSTATVTAKATIAYFDADNKYQTKPVEGAQTFTHTKEADALFAGTDWTIADNKNVTAINKIAADKIKHSIAVSGEGTMYLNAEINYTKAGKADGTVAVNGDTKYTYESADTNTLIVNATTGELLPVKKGAAQVVIKKTANGATSVIDVVTIEITDAVVPNASYTKAVSKVKINSTPALIDAATITAYAVSNYGVKTAANLDSASVKIVANNFTANDIKVTVAGNVATITASKAGISGTALVEVKTLDGKYTISEYFSFASKETATTYSVKVAATDSKVDTTIASKAGAYYDVNVTTSLEISKQNDGYTIGSASAKPYVTGLTPVEGELTFKVIGAQGDVTSKVASGASMDIVVRKASTADGKLPVGDYTVIVYKFVANNINTISEVARATFTVTDSQPELKVIASPTVNEVTIADRANPAVGEFTTAFDKIVKYGNDDVTITGITASVNGDYVVVTELQYYDTGAKYTATVKGTWVFKIK